jgi:hypothetical protein
MVGYIPLTGIHKVIGEFRCGQESSNGFRDSDRRMADLDVGRGIQM